MNDIIQVDHFEVDALVQFSEQNPWKPKYLGSMVQRFLTELISNRNLVFDLHDQTGRVSAAVLLDKVNNPANDACLEILGVRADADPIEPFKKIIALVKQHAPKHRSGFQLCIHEQSEINESLLTGQGMKKYYETYEMQFSGIMKNPSRKVSEIIDAKVDDKDEVYDVLCKAFVKNPDTSIPDMTTWKLGFLKSAKSHFYLWKNQGRVAGFANLVEPETEKNEKPKETEIRTIGVLPEFRGQGIGRALLKHCLSETEKFGYLRSHLTVAVTNKNALGLYLDAGFEPIEKYQCYRMDFDR